MSFILEDAKMERLAMNEAYSLHHPDSMFTVLSLIMIPLLAGCLVIAFMILRKPAKLHM